MLTVLLLGVFACAAWGQNPGGCRQQPVWMSLDPPSGTPGRRGQLTSNFTLTGQFLASTSITVTSDSIIPLQVAERSGNDTFVSFLIIPQFILSNPINGVITIDPMEVNCSSISISVGLFPQGITIRIS